MRNLFIYLKNNIFKLVNLKHIIIHPFLIIIYPVLFLYIRTGFEIELIQIFRSIIFLLLFSAVLLASLYWFLRDWDRTGILTTLWIVYLFYFGSSFRVIQGKSIIGINLSNPITLFILWTILFGFLSIIIIKSHLKYSEIFTLWLNIVAIVVILQPIFYTAVILKLNSDDPLMDWNPNQIVHDPIIIEGPLPDIYYIVLDGYGREDILFEVFNYSNQDFINGLRNRDFYIADQSNTNYVQTALSLASSLNLDYLSQLQESGESSRNRIHLKNLISESQIREFLNFYNYQLITFNTGYNLTKIEDPDIYFDNFVALNSFEEVILSNSILFLLDDYSNNKLPFFSYKTHRSRIQFTLDQIQDIPSIEAPTFTVAHIMIPHPPFVFDKDGKPVSPDWPFNIQDANLFSGSRSYYKSGYIDQLIYANDQVLSLIDTVMNESESPPIIIIQGDHGSRMLLNWDSEDENCFREAGSILNAYYLPGIDLSNLYPSISPVNSFRIVLNEFFSQNLPILEDRTYFSNFSQPYNFEDITDKLTEACDVSGFSQ